MAAVTSDFIPDGAAARDAMFSARFDGTETEQRFREVYRILKDRNYPVMMVEEGAGGDFGASTAIFLGRLRKHKGVMLSVCTSHYGEMTKSKYSSFEEVKFAHGHNLEILPLRVCDDPWPPEPPSGPNHPDKEGEAEGLLALAIPPSQIYIDCRRKDARWIAAQIAKKLHQKGRPGTSPTSTGYSQDAKGDVGRALHPEKAAREEVYATSDKKHGGYEQDPPPHVASKVARKEVYATFDKEHGRRHDWEFDGDEATCSSIPKLLVSAETASTGILRWCIKSQEGSEYLIIGIIPAEKAEDDWALADNRGYGIKSKGTGGAHPAFYIYKKYIEVIADLDARVAKVAVGETREQMLEATSFDIPFQGDAKLAITGRNTTKVKWLPPIS